MSLLLTVVVLATPSSPGDGGEVPAFTVRAVSPALFVVQNKVPATATRRVQLNGLWYDRHPGGKLDYCVECNKGRVPPAGTTVTPREHDALIRAGAVYSPPQAPPAARGVAAPRPFRRPGGMGGGFHAGHDCPNCGRAQYVVSGGGPGGTHTHTCGGCGTSWHH